MAQSKVFKGVMWAGLQRFGNLGISFISNMVLARLLTPDDFGTIGMLMFFIAIAQTFVDGGFGSALIQKKEISQNDKSTVFFTNFGMSLLLYALLFLFAPAIARFYDLPILCDLLRVMGLVVIINGFGLVQSAQLMKRMDFKKLCVCNLVGSAIIAVSGIVAALLGCGVWSFVIRTLCGAIVSNALLWIVGHWRPSFMFSKESFRQLFSFGGFMLLSSVITSVSNNVQNLIIGKLFRPATVGNFTQARTLRNLSSEGIASVIGQVLYPDFAKYQDNDKIIAQRLEKSAYLLSYVVSFLMLLLILVATPLIHLVYGHQWDEAIPYFQILCIGGIPICLQDININVIKAKGRSKLLFICNLLKATVYIAMMIVGAKLWGMMGFIWVMVIYTTLVYTIYAVISSKLIHTTIGVQLKQLFTCTLLSVIPYVVVTMLHQMISFENNILWLCVDVVLFSSLYLALSAITHIQPFLFFKELLLISKKSDK